MRGDAPSDIFDRRLLRKRRDRAADRYADVSFLVDEMTERVVERLADVRRSFDTTLVLGAHTGQVTAALPRGQVGDVIQADLSPAMIAQVSGPRLALDEEKLPFGFDRFDLVIAVGNLHWVNDLPGALIQIRYALKPDGLLLAAMPGGRTLHELRACLKESEVHVNAGRVAPFIDVPDAGDLLRRTGYALPVADIDTLTVTYAHPLKLLQDLRGMAESNTLLESARLPLPDKPCSKPAGSIRSAMRMSRAASPRPSSSSCSPPGVPDPGSPSRFGAGAVRRAWPIFLGMATRELLPNRRSATPRSVRIAPPAHLLRTKASQDAAAVPSG